ncbi:DUF6098 family protein [Spirillospora sp. NPDC048911]|uniref:DUF6098 family protein n=1 Tax=Spirillospora sp. NPDC048911 TaxID=3364527 RepID=UPI003713F75C
MCDEELPTITTLDELAGLVEGTHALFVRWSRGPDADAAGSSKDALTGVDMPGLSANPLIVEDWWRPRPTWIWVARRLYDYSHLEHEKAPGIRPWVLEGEELARGPDNEPLVRVHRPVAWVAESVLAEVRKVMTEQNGRWGPLRRP